jgi:hypothetical protein
MRNNQQLDRYLPESKLKLAVGEQTRIPIRVVTDGVTAQKQLELFGNELLGPESVPADDSPADDEDEQAEKKAVRDHDARSAIVLAALEAATTPAIRRRLHGEALAVVVEVPAAASVQPIKEYFDAIRSQDRATFARTGSAKHRDKATVGNDEVARKISAGRWVVGIAANPTAILPHTLTAAADVTIKIAQPNAAVIRKTIPVRRRGHRHHASSRLQTAVYRRSGIRRNRRELTCCDS